MHSKMRNLKYDRKKTRKRMRNTRKCFKITSLDNASNCNKIVNGE